MRLLQEEREIILGNECVESFEFAEVEEFVKNADKELFISHHFAKKEKMLVQPRGGFPTYKKQFALNEFFVNVLIGFMQNIILMIGILIAMFIKDVQMTLCCLLVMTIIILITYIVQKNARKIFLAKELTKKYQRYVFGTANECLEKLDGNFRGEEVVVIEAGSSHNESAVSQNDILELDLPKKTQAKLISKITGENTKACYQRLLNL